MKTILTVGLTVTLVLVMTPELAAQEPIGPRASQHGAVAQTVNETVIALEYDRPTARGRELFGEIVDWEAVWTPGANRTTWIDVSTPVVFEGIPLEAGRYGIWLYPNESEPWEVVLVRDWDTHHSFYPFESEALRVGVRPIEAEHMEALAFYFPLVGPYETVLRMHWGNTALPLRIEVPWGGS
jgi:hypothetical protein